MVTNEKVIELGVIFQMFTRRFGLVFYRSTENTHAVNADSHMTPEQQQKYLNFADFASEFLSEAEDGRRTDRLQKDAS